MGTPQQNPSGSGVGRSIVCPQCGHGLKLPSAHVGPVARCPYCRGKIAIAELAEPVAGQPRDGGQYLAGGRPSEAPPTAPWQKPDAARCPSEEPWAFLQQPRPAHAPIRHSARGRRELPTSWIFGGLAVAVIVLLVGVLKYFSDRPSPPSHASHPHLTPPPQERHDRADAQTDESLPKIIGLRRPSPKTPIPVAGMSQPERSGADDRAVPPAEPIRPKKQARPAKPKEPAAGPSEPKELVRVISVSRVQSLQSLGSLGSARPKPGTALVAVEFSISGVLLDPKRDSEGAWVYEVNAHQYKVLTAQGASYTPVGSGDSAALYDAVPTRIGKPAKMTSYDATFVFPVPEGELRPGNLFFQYREIQRIPIRP